VNAQQRFEGQAQARNEPSELPSIAQEIANIRGEALESLMVQSTQNFLQLFNLNLPKLNLIH
jgi:Tat protein secretion system quality control protein TatD with DNase activity